MPAPLTVPIEFEYEGVLFSGSFVSSTGNEHAWDLVLYGYHYGMLVKYSHGWQWCPNGKAPMFPEPYMEQFFIKTVEDFTKSH